MAHPLNGKYRLAFRPALALAITHSLCVATIAVLPSTWEGIGTAALGIGLFAAGILVAQHAPIWESSEAESAEQATE